MKMNMKSVDIVRIAVKLLDDKKARDIAVMNVGELTSLGNYFVICSGGSTTQVKALADELEVKLSDAGLKPRRVESDKGAQWVLLDYGDVICHIFYHETRDFYCLERLWGDAPKVDINDFLM
jgi:ribosome-associated protein